RADGRHLDDALALHRGAPPAGQHPASTQGGVPPVLYPAPPAEPPGAQGAEEPRGSLRRLTWRRRQARTSLGVDRCSRSTPMTTSTTTVEERWRPAANPDR